MRSSRLRDNLVSQSLILACLAVADRIVAQRFFRLPLAAQIHVDPIHSRILRREAQPMRQTQAK